MVAIMKLAGTNLVPVGIQVCLQKVINITQWLYAKNSSSIAIISCPSLLSSGLLAGSFLPKNE